MEAVDSSFVEVDVADRLIVVVAEIVGELALQ